MKHVSTRYGIRLWMLIVCLLACGSLFADPIVFRTASARSWLDFDRATLTSIVIPDTVTHIRNEAFSGCTSLVSVVIPKSVKSIGHEAFKACSSLTSVVIPEGVESIGEGSFSDCTSLTSIVLPKSLKYLGQGAFWNNPSLTEIVVARGNRYFCTVDGVLYDKEMKTLIAYPAAKQSEKFVIPNGVTSINSGALYDCRVLRSVVIPESMEDVTTELTGIMPLSECIVAPGNPYFTSVDGVLYNKSMTLLIAYPAGKKADRFEIPEGVTSVNYSCFKRNQTLSVIVISESVEEIDTWAFAKCPRLTELVVSANNPYFTSVDGVLYNKSMTELVVFPTAKKADRFVMPEHVNSIATGAFEDCTAITSVVISQGVTYIPEGAFSGCTSLTTVEICEGVTEISYDAFEFCTGLTHVWIPKSVNSILSRAFYGCSKLKEVHIANARPQYISVGYNAFAELEGCTLYVPAGSEEAYRTDGRFAAFAKVKGE